MKKCAAFFALLLLAGFSGIARAQNVPGMGASVVADPARDFMMMKNGKMMMPHGGKMMPMTANMTMTDGSVCMVNGTCKRTDDTVTKMKDGDHCMIVNGRVMVHHGAEKRQMKAGKMNTMKT